MRWWWWWKFFPSIWPLHYGNMLSFGCGSWWMSLEHRREIVSAQRSFCSLMSTTKPEHSSSRACCIQTLSFFLNLNVSHVDVPSKLLIAPHIYLDNPSIFRNSVTGTCPFIITLFCYFTLNFSVLSSAAGKTKHTPTHTHTHTNHLYYYTMYLLSARSAWSKSPNYTH